MNFKQLTSVVAAGVVAASMVMPSATIAAGFTPEYVAAHEWATTNGIIKKTSIEEAEMTISTSKAMMAKMLVNFAEKYGFVDANSKISQAGDCKNFADIDYLKNQDLHEYVIRACEYGIMWRDSASNGVAKNFAPQQKVSRAIFATALDRVLSKDLNNGKGNDWYTAHLNALNKLWIMKDTNNAGRDVIKGDVLLMLHRSVTNLAEKMKETSECTKLEQVVCMLGGECSEACSKIVDVEPKETTDPKDDDKVKSGKLIVKATAAEGRKVVIPGTSDMDTLTFKTSEDVTISKIVLEQYGYSLPEDVEEVRLEDEDGNVIAEPKTLSKAKANLTLKKDFKTIDGTIKAKIVVTTTGSKQNGTLGFKVVSVDSTAKDLDLADYTPYEYDMVTYSGVAVKVALQGSDKDYNYEEGESYELARLKITANGADILVNGFTLTNDGDLDVTNDLLDKVTVTAGGEKVSGVKVTANKDDELVISFDKQTIAMNKNMTFVVSSSFSNFEDYGKSVKYYVDGSSKLNAVERKTGARITFDADSSCDKTDAKNHTFNGGKIKLSNTKLGNIDASQGSEGVVVAEGNITITEPISKLSFTVNSDNKWVSAVKMFVNGDEFEAKKNGTGFEFKNIDIEKSGKIQFAIDVEDNDNASGTIQLSPTFNKDAISGARYDNVNEDVKGSDVSGSISFSKVTIQAAKSTLKNDLTKDVEVLQGETSPRKVVFDGTYTAKKAEVLLNSFYMSGAIADDLSGNKVTYFLSIDGEEVADTDNYGSSNKEDFSDIKIKAGESVKVKVEVEVEAYGNTGDIKDIKLVLGGKDAFDKDIKEASANIKTIKVKESGSVTIAEANTDKNTVLLKTSNAKIAEFTVVPSNNAEGLTLDNITFEGTINTNPIKADQIHVYIDGAEEDAVSGLTYEPNEDLPTKGIKVRVELDEEVIGNVELKVANINGKNQTRTYTKQYAAALVKIKAQEDLSGTTKFYLSVEKADDDYTVSNVTFHFDGEQSYTINGEVVDGDDFEVGLPTTTSNAIMLTSIAYTVKDADGNDVSPSAINK